jgi:DNA-binding MarR family transcriptional regulator
LTRRTEPDDSNLAKSITLGIGAAFLVPLFLNTISSSLLNEIRDKPNDQTKNILVFFGFCLVGAISSKTFIQTISRRVLEEAREAKQAAKAAGKKAEEIQSAVEPILEKETEGESEKGPAGIVAPLPQLDDQEWKVLEALAHGEKALRTRTGIAKQTGMSHAEVSRVMDVLRDKNLVDKKEMKKENGDQMRRWYITGSGRNVVETRKQ